MPSANGLHLFSRTPIGRARAWLRLALMQKKMADYFRAIVDQVTGLAKQSLQIVPFF